MNTANMQSGAMLKTDAARKSVFATVIDLYTSEVAFRGMIDFAVIGAIVLMFLHPIGSVQWPWSCMAGDPSCTRSQSGASIPGVPHGAASVNGSVSTTTPNSGTLSSTQPPIAMLDTKSPALKTAGPVVPIDYPSGFKTLRLGIGFLFDIDRSAFKSSDAINQPRLTKALTALARREPDNVIESLREADSDDPNVALMRGAAFVIRNTKESNPIALALWRNAVNAGQKQAKALLGRLLVSGRAGTKIDKNEGRKLIELGAGEGDRQAMRFAGIGYMSGDFGTLNIAKGIEFLKKAADGGDAAAMAFYSRIAAEGIGLPAPDGKQAEHYLRAAAKAGHTMAQYTLGRWLTAQYKAGLNASPQEAIEWLMKAYEKGRFIQALNEVAYVRGSAAKKKPWLDKEASFDLLRRCAGYRHAHCQFNNGFIFAYGFGGKPNLVLARAHIEIAKAMKFERASAEATKLDQRLTSEQKKRAAALSDKINASLKPLPMIVPLQYEGIETLPPPTAETPTSLIQATASAPIKNPDYDLCVDRTKNHKPRGEACARVIKQGGLQPIHLASAYFGRAYMHDKLKQFDKAIADYTEAIKLNPEDSGARNNLGTVYLIMNQLDKALASFNELLTKHPKHVNGLANRAETYRRQKQFSTARADVNKALEINKEHSWAKTVLQRIEADMQPQTTNESGDTQQNSNDQNEVVKSEPESDDTKKLRARALRHVKDKDYDSAIADFTDLIRNGSQNPNDFNDRGISYAKKGDLKAALADYGRAISRPGHSGHPHYNRALIFTKRGKLDKALSDLDAAIKEHGLAKWNVVNERASVRMRKGLHERAINDYTRLIKMSEKSKNDSNRTYAFYWRGEAKIGAARDMLNYRCSLIGGDCPKHPDYKPAILDFSQAILINPNYAPAHFKNGWMMSELGRYKLAVENYTLAIKADPTYSMAYNNRGLNYYNLKKSDLALADFTDAIRHDSQNKYAWANRGVLFGTMRRSRRKNRRRAISDCREALKIDQNYGFAQKCLTKLGARP